MDSYSIGFGLSLPAETSAWFEERDLSIDLAVELHEGRYVCTNVSVSALSGGPPGITGESLRELKVGELTEIATRNSTCEERLATVGRQTVEEADGPTPQSLEIVAAAYRYGHAIGDRPTREVMDLLGLSRSKAARWISMARDQGLLEETRRGVPGGVVLSGEKAQQRMSSLRLHEKQLQERVNELQHHLDETQATARRGEGTLRAILDQRADELRAALDREHERLSEVREEINDMDNSTELSE